MFDASWFRQIVSGRRRGASAALWRAALRMAELPYAAAVSWRNRRYDGASALSHRVGVPVVSVGNLTMGGTGKTPLVEWLARWLRRQNVRVALISRGYGAEAGARNDEALELDQKLPDVPHLQSPDRVEAARTAIEKLDCQIILLDDAFQHRRIRRDLDIVLIDALEPFGYEHVFPRGTLREPLRGLARADVVALSRADMVGDERRSAIRERVRELAPSAAWLELAHRPRVLLSSTGTQARVETLVGRPVAAFCGIGNPEGFRHTLRACDYDVAELRPFPDHHSYDRRDVESLAQWADGLDIEAVVATHKDLVKLGMERLGTRPLWALVVGIEILSGEKELVAKLRPLVERIARPAD